MGQRLSIGGVVPVDFWKLALDARREVIQRMVGNGIDHVFVADHVSFFGGGGSDGFVEVAALSQTHPRIGLMIGVYLLPLRHPLPVARQLATMHRIAPGRLLFGVGIGGEDRHEVEVCGVDPATRGRRVNESLGVIRALMQGRQVDLDGEFFKLERARIKPAVEPPIPIIIGGRSDAALRRTGHFGDGWIAAWCSVERFTAALQIIDQAAGDAGRQIPAWQHGYQPWLGVADSRKEARQLVKPAMESFYKIPFERFERYTPYGTPDDVAAALAPYVDAGASIMNLKVVAASDDAVIEATGAVAQALRARAAARQH